MKRLLAALLTFFALLALTGCGGSSSDGPHLLPVSYTHLTLPTILRV